MGLLERTCLNKTHSLRRQMVFTYSSAAVLTIMAVMIMVSRDVVQYGTSKLHIVCFRPRQSSCIFRSVLMTHSIDLRP